MTPSHRSTVQRQGDTELEIIALKIAITFSHTFEWLVREGNF